MASAVTLIAEGIETDYILRNSTERYLDGKGCIGCFQNLSKLIVYDTSFEEGGENPFAATDVDISIARFYSDSPLAIEGYLKNLVSHCEGHLVPKHLDEDDALAIGVFENEHHGRMYTYILFANLHSAVDVQEEFFEATCMHSFLAVHANKEDVKKQFGEIDDKFFRW